MLISETVTMKWNSRIKQWYISKGYVYTKMGDSFQVKIEDLTPYSATLVTVKCDYCGKEYKMSYFTYQHSNNNIINKYSCKKCKGKKKKEKDLVLLETNELNKKESGYYLIREHRIEKLKELLDTIKGRKFDILYKNKEFINLKALLIYYNENIYQEIESLGYSIEDNFIRKPTGYYNDFNHLKKSIENFIKVYDRFPMQNDFVKIMHISSKIYQKYGTLEEIRSKIGYDNNKDLIDDNGYCNKSLYEYYTAQFLINNNITYKREQHPFPKEEGHHRSNFMFITNNREKIHCEVWGCPKKYPTEYRDFSKEYNIKRENKEKLYKKYKINLISIDCEIFDYKNYNQIDENLYEIFKLIFSTKLKHLEIEKYIPASKLTNEELLEGIMNFSTNGTDLPPCTKINNPNYKKFYKFYKEISKRFDTYESFAKEFNKNIGTKAYIKKSKTSNLTNIELINKVMEYSDNENTLPSIFVIQYRDSNLYTEILKRYDNYINFVTENNLTFSNRQHNKFNNIIQVYNIYEYMINTYGKIIPNDNLSNYKTDLNLIGIKNAPRKFNITSTNLELQFFQYCIENNKQNLINDIEKKWIEKIANNKSCNQFKYSEKQQNIAKEILNKLK